MSWKKGKEQDGSAILRAVIIVAIVILVIFGAYKFIPWAWHGWPRLATATRVFWQVRVADPIFRAMIQVLVATRGRPLVGIATIALANFLLFKLNAIISAVPARNMLKETRKTQAVEEMLIGQMENVQDTLKKLFADDLEKIALFGGRIRSAPTDGASANPVYAGCVGCLPNLVWMSISAPLMLMVGLAVYDGLLRLFVTAESLDSLMASSGSHAEQLRAILPFEKTVSVGKIFLIQLADHSMVLTVILMVVGLIAWFVGSISKSGRTVPRLTRFYPIFLYILITSFSYFFLNAALLIFAICWIIYTFIYMLLTKLLFRPLYLRARAAMSSRSSPANGLEDPTSTAA